MIYADVGTHEAPQHNTITATQRRPINKWEKSKRSAHTALEATIRTCQERIRSTTAEGHQCSTNATTL